MKIKNILFGVLSLLAFITYAQDRNVEITYERRDDNSIDFYYTKNVPGSYSIRITFNNLENCNNNSVFEDVIKYDSGHLFTLRPYDEKRGISFSYRSRYVMGNPKPKIKNNIIYALPFQTGKEVKIMEASNLSKKYFGNDKPIDFKSFVVHSATPDTIYAMRRGTVVKLVDKYENDNNIKKVYTSKRNRIIIEHPDGSYATYTGFNKNKIFVELGQEVYPHTPLGVLEKFNQDYRLDFNVYHYLRNLLEDLEGSLRDREHKVKYLNPNFFIDNGGEKIKSGETYKVLFNDEIKLQEFSRKEKRKYKKDPSLFK